MGSSGRWSEGFRLVEVVLMNLWLWLWVYMYMHIGGGTLCMWLVGWMDGKWMVNGW